MSLSLQQSQPVASLRLYEPGECSDVVARLKQLAGWKAALIRQRQEGGNYESALRADIRSASALISAEVPGLSRQFEQKLDLLVKPLIRKIWKLDLRSHSGTHLLKYEPGEHYSSHRDTGLGFERRYFSVVCYLNDDFEGGRTLFPTLNYAATPKAGEAILFPSNYLHASEPVISGQKFVFVSWIEGAASMKWI